MIVRYPLECETCGQAHTVRIGLGQDASQTHKFRCRNCNEEIEIRVGLDHAQAGWEIVCISNCHPNQEVAGSPIVNLDPNFLISPEEQGKDMTFPRLRQMHALVKAAEKAGSLVDLSEIPRGSRNSRPFRQLDFGEEWKLLKKAWSLARNDRLKLSKQRVAAGSAEFYANDPLKSLQDWVRRFALFVCQPGYEQMFRDAMKVLEPLGKSDLSDFGKAYNGLSSERGDRYFAIMKDFFAAFSEFAQVYLFVAKGMELPKDHHATSVDFDAVKMFYGNTFEHFTSLVVILALLNNMLLGRAFDEFQTLTLPQ